MKFEFFTKCIKNAIKYLTLIYLITKFNLFSAGYFGSMYTIPKIESKTEIIDHDANSYGHSNLTRYLILNN